jgi:hypothetical protein
MLAQLCDTKLDNIVEALGTSPRHDHNRLLCFANPIDQWAFDTAEE